MTNYGRHTEAQVAQVVAACEAHGSSSIIALSGVPATGKSFVAEIAAQRHAGEATRVRAVQFHQSFTYEEFVEGLRIVDSGAVVTRAGLFLEWNQIAEDDGKLRYVLLIDELTRANVAAVLGELLTYIEYRDRTFYSLYSRMPIRIATNLTILATFNPVDRSAIDLDNALLRRLRIVDFPPSAALLDEMLQQNGLDRRVIDRLRGVFDACENEFGSAYGTLMPFGHGMFADVRGEEDLHPLWQERVRHMLFRPTLDPHAFAETIQNAYPWTDPEYRVPPSESEPGATAEVHDEPLMNEDQ